MSYLLFQGARRVQSLHQWSVRISRGWRGKTLNKEASSVSSIAGKWKRINLVLKVSPTGDQKPDVLLAVIENRGSCAQL